MKQISLSNVHLDELLCRLIQSNCKELHLRIGRSPLTRLCNDDLPGELSEFEAFTLLDLTQIVYAILTDEQIIQLESEKELKVPYSVARIAKFDVHIVKQKGSMEAGFHRIPSARPLEA